MTSDIEREELHHRQIDIRFYKRSDGLYEVIGRLLDRKNQSYRRQLATQDTPAGTPVHDISVHLVVDESLQVHEAFARMDATPFAVCPGATQALGALKGERMTGGWNKRVRELLGGAISCTHIVELMGPMATTAFQGFAPQRIARAARGEFTPEQRKAKVDSCYAYGAQRDVVARLWPELSVREPEK